MFYFQACSLSCYCYSSTGNSIISSALFHKYQFFLCIQSKFIFFCFVLKSLLLSYLPASFSFREQEEVSQWHFSLSSAAFPLLLLLLKPDFCQHFINDCMYSLPSFLQSLKCTFVTITHWQCALTSAFRSCCAAWTQPIVISTAHFRK